MSDLALPRSVRLRVALRSFLVQGSWNYETLIGTGFAFSLLPALRYVAGEDSEKLQRVVARHADLFNSHPYLASVAMGAVGRLEADGTPEQVTLRFKNALRGSLGSLGDQLFWKAWRPCVMLGGLLLALLGLPWWAALGVTLGVYNVVHVGSRLWGLNLGLRSGLEVGRALRDAPLQNLAARAGDAAAVLAGAAITLVVLGDGGGFPLALVLAAAAALGAWLGPRARPVATGVVAAVLLLGMIVG